MKHCGVVPLGNVSFNTPQVISIMVLEDHVIERENAHKLSFMSILLIILCDSVRCGQPLPGCGQQSSSSVRNCPQCRSIIHTKRKRDEE
jgi:hypothetical protein